jgi:hypothetical protein
MSDSSSISGANNPAGLPEKFTFSISHEEAKSALQLATRYGPDPYMGYRFQLQFGETTRRWVMREQNITGFQDFDAEGGPTSGHLTLTVNVLEFAAQVFGEAFSTTVVIDFTTGKIQLQNCDVTIEVDLPLQDAEATDLSFAAVSFIKVSTNDLQQLGQAHLMFPVTIDPDELVLPIPFIEFDFDCEKLTARRDWSLFGGPKISVSVPAKGVVTRTFASFPGALPRELFYSDVYGENSVKFCFSDETPNIAFLKGSGWGIRIELGNETVHQYRHDLMQTLSDNEIDVDTDERIGWSPIVSCHFEGTEVAVEIVKGVDGQPDYFRLSTVVLPDSPWNLEIASEINGWNNQWTNVKLVRHETDLFAIRDVVAEEMQLTPEAVIDLVMKSKIVAEVVGVFL